MRHRLSAPAFILLCGVGVLLGDPVSPDFKLGEQPRLIRREFSADGEPLRATEIADIAHVSDWQRVASVSLFSSGQIRFVKLNEIDHRDNRRIETIINERGQQAEFRRAPDSSLTKVERKAGAGFLTIGGASIKFTPAAAGTDTFRRKVSAMLSAWDPAEREALEILYKKTLACGLSVGGGVLLPILFGDPPAGGCEPGMVEARPDPERDQKFLTIMPELAEWLRTPARLMTETTLHVNSNVCVDNLTEDVVRDLINRMDMAHYAKDPEAVLRLLAPDFEMETHQDCGGITVRTRSDYDAFMRDHFEHALDFRWDRTIEGIEIAADRQSAVMRASGTERTVWPSGTTVSAADTVTEIRLNQGRPVVSRLTVRCKPSAE